MLYMYAEVKEVLQAWGVEAVEVETRAEAQRASIQCNTDWCVTHTGVCCAWA
jgi:hypothetical protein